MTPAQIDFYKRLARGITQQFGSHCEVVVHDFSAAETDNSIIAIENGYVSGRQVGDGPSHVVLEALEAIKAGEDVHDRGPYLTRTADGKVLKSGTIFLRDENGVPEGLLALNFDITVMKDFEAMLWGFIGEEKSKDLNPEPIARNIGEMLDDLFAECESMIGKPAAEMTKEERVRAIAYLEQRGAFLVSKSSQKACEFFGISKYSFYSYLDEAKDINGEAAE